MVTTPIFIDTEFLDDGHRLEAISFALVAPDKQEYYAVSADCDVGNVVRHPWLREHVVPHLPLNVSATGWAWDTSHPDFAQVKPRTQIATEIRAFITQFSEPELWAFFSPYDHVVLTQLYGPLSELPAPIPPFTRDLMQEAQRSTALLPQQSKSLHHALADARHNLAVAVAIGLLQDNDTAHSFEMQAYPPSRSVGSPRETTKDKH